MEGGHAAVGAPFKVGDAVYRKGKPCTVAQISYATHPPHVVFRNEAGAEVGTEGVSWGAEASWSSDPGEGFPV